ncbi:hypothetical protein WA026_003348 [Henosepilachna vigintioctopunctata]|uniref:Uncharacterized protein n=1 Tax=Henosepilachna vigintioctopunctata TaxID=420089 RepID=A0AAW1TIA4_9CUCU
MGNASSSFQDMEFWFKVVEFILALLIFIVWAVTTNAILVSASIAAVSMGYWVIWLGFIVAFLFDDKHRFLDIFFLIAGIIVFLWTTIDILYRGDGYSKTETMSLGVIAIAEVVVIAVDIILKVLDKF